MTRWVRSEVADFLERLRAAGDYSSVNEMAREIGGLDPSTLRKWSRPARQPQRRDRAPKSFEPFLAAFAKRHRCDADALRERWEIVAATPTTTEGVVERLDRVERQVAWLIEAVKPVLLSPGASSGIAGDPPPG